MTRDEFVEKAKELGYTNTEILDYVKFIEEEKIAYGDFILIEKPKT